MNPENIFDPDPGGVMTPENIFDPDPGGVNGAVTAVWYNFFFKIKLELEHIDFHVIHHTYWQHYWQQEKQVI